MGGIFPLSSSLPFLLSKVLQKPFLKVLQKPFLLKIAKQFSDARLTRLGAWPVMISNLDGFHNLEVGAHRPINEFSEALIIFDYLL